MDIGKQLQGTQLASQSYIGEKVDALHRILQVYSPTFDVVYNPEGRLIGGEVYNFAILESPPGVEPYIIRYLKVEHLENPGAIRDWVAAGDLRQHRPQEVLARIEQEEQLKRDEKARLVTAKREADADFTASAVRGGINRLHTFRHGGRKYT